MPTNSTQGYLDSKSKNKRQRKDGENPSWQFVQQPVKYKGTKFKNATPRKVGSEKPSLNKTSVIYDLGNGARSTIKMKAVSDSRFILLHEDEESQIPENAMEMTSQGECAFQEVVPETQMHVEKKT